MNPLDVLIAAIAATQFGVISRGQLIGLGMSPEAIKRRLRSGALLACYPGVYRLPGAPRSLDQTLMAGQLWAGPRSAVSHRAAAACLGLDGVRRGIIELTTAHRRPPPSGRIRLHYDPELSDDEVMLAGPLTITTPARTVLDLGAVVAPWTVELAVEDAIRRGLVSREQLYEVLNRHAARGRNGVGALRLTLDAHDPNTPLTASGFELRLSRVLRDAGMPEPVKQYSAFSREGDFLGRLDFAYPDVKVGIECDSYRFHSGRLAWQRDIERRNQLVAHGWIIIQVTWHKLVRYPRLVVRDVERALSLRI